MNERIQQLADKIWEEKYWTNPNTDKLLAAQLNKFAELIVRECAGVCDDERDSTDSEFGKLVAESCALKIMERFGIEE